MNADYIIPDESRPVFGLVVTISIKPVVLFGGTDTPRGPIRPPRLYIPLCVCDFLLDRLRVIRLEPPTVGSVLDNGRSWTRRINEVEDIL